MVWRKLGRNLNFVNHKARALEHVNKAKINMIKRVESTRKSAWWQKTVHKTNLWQYNGIKAWERLVDGKKDPNKVASVPFVITQEMKNQLSILGYPNEAISKLLPASAHSIIQSKTPFEDFKEDQQSDEKADVEKDSNDSKDSSNSSKGLVYVQSKDEADK